MHRRYLKVAILVNGSGSAYRWGRLKRARRGIEMGYEGIGLLLDPDPLFVPAHGKIDFAALESVDLILWEWGWIPQAPEALLAVKERLPIPVMAYTTAIDRFWRGLDPADLPLHAQAAQRVDFVGTLLTESIPFYQTWCPRAHVFHMPVPVDTECYSRYRMSPDEKDPTEMLLAAPTSFIFSHPIAHANRLDFGTFLVYDRLVQERSVRGTTYVRKPSHVETVQTLLRQSGLHLPEIRPMVRLTRAHRRITASYFCLWLPHALVQGRWAMTNAYLGIPMVTSDAIDTHRRLYPQTVVGWRDLEGAYVLCCRLMEDRAFYEEVREQALEGIERYGIETARGRLLTALRGRWPHLLPKQHHLAR